MQNRETRRGYYPPIEPHRHFYLPVSGGHELYVEECGQKDGLAVIALHGGPGGGCSPLMRRFFDPAKYRIVLFDQRGCGRSKPHASLDQNTTWDLVRDIEAIREELGIEKWVVFGGSWGSTLSLAYAQTHPDRTIALVLRGIFLNTQAELDWFYKDGASRIFPDAWDKLVSRLGEAERADVLQSYHDRLMQDDVKARREDAVAWADWETSLISFASPEPPAGKHPQRADAIARIETHYFVNKGFFESDNQLLENMDRIQHIPGYIAQGRYDVITPPACAWKLANAWQGNARLEFIPDAGHSAGEPGTVDALVRFTDEVAKRYG
ncbi:prolyl aminopeptidase [Hyphobacterium sp. HN65]|uniref:Proline iminopeptidase n=1 Tax=Hyphobacterium lacteum TaxID=3116575 RepID=A0ABU7LQT3_9PROT|nr:prolyl aminopeptidase [Hyphobacterium sp. HN65]MEE2526263.1 prolyl aminopeptidase [Hyphobacterium sp. HN65]